MLQSIVFLLVFSLASLSYAVNCVSTANKILAERGLSNSEPTRTALNAEIAAKCPNGSDGSNEQERSICGNLNEAYTFAPNDIRVDEVLNYISSDNWVRVYRLAGDLKEIQTQDGLTFRYDSKCQVESVGDNKVFYYEKLNRKICDELNLPVWNSRRASLPSNFSDLETKYKQEQMPGGLEKDNLKYDKLLHPARTYEGQLWAMSKRLGGRIQPTKHGFESALEKCKQYFPESGSGATSRSSSGRP